MPRNKPKPQLNRSIVPPKDGAKYLNNTNQLIEDKVARPTDDGTPYIALKYYYHKHQCFSKWSTPDLKGFSALCEKMRNTDWETIKKSGGKDKTGFGYTVLKDYPIPMSIKNKLSRDTTFFELRASLKRRVIGFRSGPVFYLILLDKNHETT